MVIIQSKDFNNGWNVVAVIDTDTGIRSGSQFIDLPETTSNEELVAALETQYS